MSLPCASNLTLECPPEFSARSEPTGYSRAVLDCTYRVQISHRTGQLARVMGAIAEGQGLIGDVVTISVGREASERRRICGCRTAPAARCPQCPIRCRTNACRPVPA